MGAFLVLKNNFKRAMKNKVKFLLFFLIPTIAMVLTIYGNILMKPVFTVGAIDNIKSDDTHRIIQLLNKTTSLRVQEANGSSINTDLIMAKYSAIVEFKNNDKKNLEESISIYSQKKSVKEGIAKLINYYSLNNEVIDLKTAAEELFKEEMSVAQRIMGFIMMSLIITTTMISSIMIRDKEEGILTRFKYSPNKVSVYIVGNFIYNYVITYGQLATAAIVSNILNLNIGINLAKLLQFNLLIAFVTTALGTLIGSAFKNEMKANIIASVISLSTALIGGAFVPITKMPQGIKIISNITPTKWVICLTSTLENGQAFTQLNTSLVVLIFFGVISLFLSKQLSK